LESVRHAGLGPALGALLAVLFYKFIKILEYEMANPGQDGEDPEHLKERVKEEKGEKMWQRHHGSSEPRASGEA